MISDALLKISGRDKDMKELYRLTNKKINTMISGSIGSGRRFILRYTYEAFANAGRSAPLYLKAYGTRRDLEELLWSLSQQYESVQDETLPSQNFEQFKKGSQQVLERRILASIKRKHFILFLDEQKRIPQSMYLFLRTLMDTGNLTIVAVPADLKDGKARDFYGCFDTLLINPIASERMEALFEYLISKSSISIKEDEHKEIRQRIVREVAGIPGRLVEYIHRAEKEREFRLDMLELLPSAHRQEYSIGWTLSFLAALGLLIRYISRGTGLVGDTILGGIICVLSLIFYRTISRNL